MGGKQLAEVTCAHTHAESRWKHALVSASTRQCLVIVRSDADAKAFRTARFSRPDTSVPVQPWREGQLYSTEMHVAAMLGRPP